MYRLSMYSPLHNWKEGDIPTNPYVSISLDTYFGKGIDKDTKILISNQLFEDQEIDYAVNELKKELDEFSGYSGEIGHAFRLKSAACSGANRPPCRSEATLDFSSFS